MDTRRVTFCFNGSRGTDLPNMGTGLVFKPRFSRLYEIKSGLHVLTLAEVPAHQVSRHCCNDHGEIVCNLIDEMPNSTHSVAIPPELLLELNRRFHPSCKIFSFSVLVEDLKKILGEEGDPSKVRDSLSLWGIIHRAVAIVRYESLLGFAFPPACYTNPALFALLTKTMRTSASSPKSEDKSTDECGSHLAFDGESRFYYLVPPDQKLPDRLTNPEGGGAHTSTSSTTSPFANRNSVMVSELIVREMRALSLVMRSFNERGEIAFACEEPFSQCLFNCIIFLFLGEKFLLEKATSRADLITINAAATEKIYARNEPQAAPTYAHSMDKSSAAE
ncbi:MAG: hypothetical protein LBB14_03960 [Puniceicoccales bacterium]|jgi:hypothetical protein|nr:hypothetical protein [Puniceicoccales bacterium]